MNDDGIMEMRWIAASHKEKIFRAVFSDWTFHKERWNERQIFLWAPQRNKHIRFQDLEQGSWALLAISPFILCTHFVHIFQRIYQKIIGFTSHAFRAYSPCTPISCLFIFWIAGCRCYSLLSLHCFKFSWFFKIIFHFIAVDLLYAPTQSQATFYILLKVLTPSVPTSPFNRQLLDTHAKLPPVHHPIAKIIIDAISHVQAISHSH